jgi:hypothetical protein
MIRFGSARGSPARSRTRTTIFDSRDLHEGVVAFFAKRALTFEGR